MTEKEQEAMNTAIDALTEGFNRLQTLQMTFAVCASVCRILMDGLETDRQIDMAKKFIREVYIDELADRVENNFQS